MPTRAERPRHERRATATGRTGIQRIGGELAVGQCVRDSAGQLQIAKGRGEQIDGDRYPDAPGVPLGGIPERLRQDHLGDRAPQAVLTD